MWSRLSRVRVPSATPTPPGAAELERAPHVRPGEEPDEAVAVEDERAGEVALRDLGRRVEEVVVLAHDRDLLAREHAVAHRSRLPSLRGTSATQRRGEQPDDVAVVGDGVCRVAGRPGDVVHELPDVTSGRRHGIADDDVSDAQPTEGLAGEQRPVLRAGGLQEEPAEKAIQIPLEGPER